MNALHDPQIPLDAKTQVRSNLSRCTFYVIRTGPIRAWKIMHQRFAPRSHQNALRDPQILLDAKTQVRCTVSQRAFYVNRTRSAREWKIMHWRFTPECTGICYVTCISHQMQKHKFSVTCPDTLFMESVSVPPSMKNSTLTFCSPDAPECTTWPSDPTRCKNISSL
jgi:hypothetical protein